MSADWIVPLRHELFELRGEMARALARPLPHAAAAWMPGPAPAAAARPTRRSGARAGAGAPIGAAQTVRSAAARVSHGRVMPPGVRVRTRDSPRA